METARQTMQQLQARVLANPEKIAEINASYKLVIEGQDRSVWSVRCRTPVEFREGESEAACTVTVAEKDFLELVHKRLNPQMAFLQGKLRVEGEKVLALRLVPLFHYFSGVI